MQTPLYARFPVSVFNTLGRRKQVFEPLRPPFVGLYLCGPTVYGDPHLGHARSALCFDIVFRYLRHIGYKVRYVRNITDVGHLVGDADAGEDKIAKRARLEQLEPMEVAQHYTDRYHLLLDRMNILRPSIEPRATGHIPEQIGIVERILANGFAYVRNGSVYLDVRKYAECYPYGELSGRADLEEALEGTRNLDGQAEKRHPADFALWKRAEPEHIMRWDSPWGPGFPGWHVECTAMSTKYLGEPFDIHGGGMDLIFPHHEAEIAQSNACNHPRAPHNEARYWMHCNMITLNGEKMAKSKGNGISLEEFYTGSHPLLEQAYGPQTIRFYILQAHYGSTIDFSNAGLQSAEKALRRLMNTLPVLKRLFPAPDPLPGTELEAEILTLLDDLYRHMSDDFNTAKAIATLFELSARIHAMHDGHLPLGHLSAGTLQRLQAVVPNFMAEVLGLQPETNPQSGLLEGTINLLIGLRNRARANRDFATSDAIRDELLSLGIQLKDSNVGTTWEAINYNGR